MSDLLKFMKAIWTKWRLGITGSGILAGVGLMEKLKGINIPHYVYWLILCTTLFAAFFGAWQDERKQRAIVENEEVKNTTGMVLDWLKLDCMALHHEYETIGDTGGELARLPFHSASLPDFTGDAWTRCKLFDLRGRYNSLTSKIKSLWKGMGWDEGQLVNVPDPGSNSQSTRLANLIPELERLNGKVETKIGEIRA
jgi:hypothetical protein